MPRPLTVIVVALCAVAVGFVAHRFGGGSAPRSGGGEPAPLTATARRPTFHVALSPEEKLDVARTSLLRLTSGRAVELGDLKDDVALVADEPSVIAFLLESFDVRAHLTIHEASAFADLFARIRHPDFVGPTAILLEHAEDHVRLKACPAARTQAHSSLTPLLARVYSEVLAQSPTDGDRVRCTIVDAARHCGGDVLPAVVAAAIADPHPAVRCFAAQVIGEERLLALLPRLRSFFEDEAPIVRLHGARAFASLGLRDGDRILAEGLRSSDEATVLFALEVVRRFRIEALAGAVRERLAASGGDVEVATAARIALGALGDRETIGLLAAVLDGEHPDPVLAHTAWHVLAATGDPRHLERLWRGVGKGLGAIESMASGFEILEGPVDLELVKAMIDGGPYHPAQVDHALRRAGDALVPHLEARLHEGGDANRVGYYVACLAAIGTPAARAALLGARDVMPRMVEPQVRRLDLDLRRGYRDW